jgi:hypothetical protein
MALVVEKQGGVGQGNASPTLYGLLDLMGTSENPFHPTTTGNNSVPGVPGFTASGATYNLATGLGSVDANLLVNDWPSAESEPQGFTLEPSAVPGPLLAGKPVSFQIVTAGTGGFTGPVSLTAKATSGVQVSFAPAIVMAGASATATVSVASGTPAGTANITILGTNGLISEAATLAFTVEAAPRLRVTSAASKVALTRGKSVALLVTTTTGGSYSGPVTLGVTGLPPGVTASWSSSSLIESGTSATTSTLTLTAAANMPPTAAMLTITASGDGLEAQTLLVVDVGQLSGIRFLPNRPRPLAVTSADRMRPALSR